jgi:Fur family ferric uptake transcriptional regulator
MKSAKTIFTAYLKNNGLLHTAQREQILDIFLKTEEHPTTEDLYLIVKKKNPNIGLATVYRAMKVICDAGLARETDFGNGQRSFEHKYQHQHHDHLVCIKCGRIIEVISPEIEKLQQKLAKKHKFSPIRHTMQIFGACAKCAGKQK